MQHIMPETWRHAFEDFGHGLKEKWGRAKGAARSLFHRQGEEASDPEALSEWEWRGALSPDAWWGGPKVAVSENAKEVRVTARMPGLTKDSFSIDVDGRLLTLRAERRTDEEKRGKSFYYRSRSFGAYLRTIPLPSEVDGDAAKAKYRNGNLVITLPKAKLENVRRIEVYE